MCLLPIRLRDSWVKKYLYRIDFRLPLYHEYFSAFWLNFRRLLFSQYFFFLKLHRCSSIFIEFFPLQAIVSLFLSSTLHVWLDDEKNIIRTINDRMNISDESNEFSCIPMGFLSIRLHFFYSKIPHRNDSFAELRGDPSSIQIPDSESWFCFV